MRQQAKGREDQEGQAIAVGLLASATGPLLAFPSPGLQSSACTTLVTCYFLPVFVFRCTCGLSLTGLALLLTD